MVDMDTLIKEINRLANEYAAREQKIKTSMPRIKLLGAPDMQNIIYIKGHYTTKSNGNSSTYV